MQQVDKIKAIVMYSILFVVSVFFIFGCSSKNNYTSTTKHFDKNITKDQILHAVKRVFKITDNDAFIIDSYRDELNITKPKAVHKLYTMDIQNDNFNFKIDDNQSLPTIDATISISRTYGVEEEERYYIDENSFTYELFWDRVEYLLGLKKDWKQCNYILSEGFMCDLVDLDNSWFTDKELIDLNTTSIDQNTTIETIDLSHIYKKQNIKDQKKKDVKEEIYIIDNNKNGNNKGKDKSSKKTDDKNNNLVKSYKLSVENNDLNNTKNYKEKVDLLKEINIEEINLDNNNTKG